MSQTSSSVLDSEPLFSNIKIAIEDGETNAAIALQFSTSEKSIRRFRKRHGLQIPGTEKAFTRIDGDTAEAATKPEQGRPVLDDPDKMLRDRGLSPEDWYIDAITVNEWEGGAGEGNKATYYQAKFTAKRKRPEFQLIAARSDGWKKPKPARHLDRNYKLVVFAGDQQAPFHDLKLHSAFCEWLEFNQPNEGVLIGDTVDFPDISRHRWNPENTASVNECTQAGYDLLRGYVSASPNTQWKKLPGNHDERLRNSIIDEKRELFGVRRPTVPGESEESPVLSVEYLLRLDELGIEYVDPQGEYAQGQVKVSDKLAARHGWLAKKGSGSSALATLEHLGFSVIIGHTHRQSLVYKTTHDINGQPSTLAAAETGCMCLVEGGLGYAVSPDWQAGFATATIWDDGKFRIDHGTFVNNTLLWREQRYDS